MYLALGKSNALLSGLLTILFLLTFGGSNQVEASIYAGPQTGWLVISSHSEQHIAINKARQQARNFPTVAVFRSTNGYYAVSLGWVQNGQGKAVINQLISSGYIPADSYVHNGKRWVQVIWTANNSHLSGQQSFLNASRLFVPGNTAPQPKPLPKPQVIAIAPTAALVGGLNRSGDNYLSLRQGPNTSFAEVVRMRTNTRLTITGKTAKWYRVKLSNGTTGFAYSKYVKIAQVPIVGPDRNADNEVPVVGPEKVPLPDNVSDNVPDNSVAEKDVPKPEKTVEVTRPDIDTDIDISNQKRVALVLGNSRYENTSALANPKNDADAISKKLENLGFTVIKGLDLGKSGMELAIRNFVKELPGADVALFFYAGHAMQVDGKNFLIPVDAALEDATALDFETINFNVILNFMNADDRTSIALLDACRNNPLARSFTRKLSKSRSAFVGRGLAAPTTSGGQLLIGFATAPGDVALDGEGDNSPFTTALLKHMDTPGLEIELMLKRVKSDVFKETDGSQSPWNNSALRNEFYFAK